MAWVISKIIGDGKTPQTAYRCSLHDHGIATKNAIQVDPDTGVPLTRFALLEVNDADAGKLLEDFGCFVVTDSNILPSLDQDLSEQGCFINVRNVKTAVDLLAAIRAEYIGL